MAESPQQVNCWKRYFILLCLLSLVVSVPFGLHVLLPTLIWSTRDLKLRRSTHRSTGLQEQFSQRQSGTSNTKNGEAWKASKTFLNSSSRAEANSIPPDPMLPVLSTSHTRSGKRVTVDAIDMDESNSDNPPPLPESHPLLIPPPSPAHVTTARVSSIENSPALEESIVWKVIHDIWPSKFYLMAYRNHAGSLSEIKRACLRLNCAAVTIERNGWLAYWRNVPTDLSTWRKKPQAKTYVIAKFLKPGAKQPEMKYGCSRHKHACRHDRKIGVAPCCNIVMLEILSDLSRVMRKHGIHWVLSQGEQLSVARDGYLQLWDHDVDPVFTSGRKADAVRIIAEEMHLSGPYAKWREADYYYNKKVAERQQTNWSKYTVYGGDFSWHNPNADSPYILQRNPTFMDIGQANVPKPTRETTFPCMPGFDILCSRKWYEQTLSRFRANFQRVPVEMPREQIPYSGYEEWRKKKDNLMFNDDGSVRSAKEREDIIEKYIAMCPDFWDKPCLGGTQ